MEVHESMQYHTIVHMYSVNGIDAKDESTAIKLSERIRDSQILALKLHNIFKDIKNENMVSRRTQFFTATDGTLLSVTFSYSYKGYVRKYDVRVCSTGDVIVSSQPDFVFKPEIFDFITRVRKMVVTFVDKQKLANSDG
jgi:hypothetical protein